MDEASAARENPKIKDAVQKNPKIVSINKNQFLRSLEGYMNRRHCIPYPGDTDILECMKVQGRRTRNSI